MGSMKVFLAGIIQGSLAEPQIHRQDWRDAFKRVLGERLPQAEVYCHYTAHPASIKYEMPTIRSTLAEGNRRAADCDLLLAYVPEASMGTAIEMYEAARAGAVVLTVSPLKVNWVIRAYSDRVFETVRELDDFLASAEFVSLTEAKKKM
jgi:hypothetical protein